MFLGWMHGDPRFLNVNIHIGHTSHNTQAETMIISLSVSENKKLTVTFMNVFYVQQQI